MPPMKIALVCPHYPPRISGLADYTRLLEQSLAGAGEIQVCTETRAEPDQNPRRPAPWWGLADGFWRQCQIVHFQYTPFLYSRRRRELNRIIQVLREKSIPLVATLHEFYRTEFGAGWKNLLLRPFFKYLDRAFMAKMDYLVVTAPGRKAAASRVIPGRVRIIPVGSNIPRVEMTGAEKSQWRQRYAARGEFLVGSFGAFHPDKRYEQVLAVLRQRRDWTWVCVGGRPNDYQRYLQDLIRLQGLAGQVFFQAGQNAEDVSRGLQTVDVFALPDVRGLSGSRGSALAALANGCAIAARRTGDTEDCFRSGENVFFIEGNLTAALTQLAADPAGRERIRQGARELNGTYFSWPKISAEHQRLYREIRRPEGK